VLSYVAAWIVERQHSNVPAAQLSALYSLRDVRKHLLKDKHRANLRVKDY